VIKRRRHHNRGPRCVRNVGESVHPLSRRAPLWKVHCAAPRTVLEHGCSEQSRPQHELIINFPRIDVIWEIIKQRAHGRSAKLRCVDSKFTDVPLMEKKRDSRNEYHKCVRQAQLLRKTASSWEKRKQTRTTLKYTADLAIKYTTNTAFT